MNEKPEDANDFARQHGPDATRARFDHGTSRAGSPNGAATDGAWQEDSIKSEPPRPLAREVPPADPFPVDALGDVLAPAARAIHDRTQAPLAICGQSVLAATTLAVQGHADVEPPTGQKKPLSIFLLSIAETGERKTAVDEQALWPIWKREANLRERYGAEVADCNNAKEAWDKARETAKGGKNKGDAAAIKAALDALGPPPIQPLVPLLTCQEPTYEGLCKLFAVGQPSLGIFASEGGQFIGGHGMSEENKLKTAAGLSAVWDGQPIKRVRGGDGTLILPGRRLAMHLMAQPDVAAIALADPLLMGQGILSRLLITAPDSASGTRMWHEPAPGSEAAMKRYGARLLDILEAPLPLACGTTNELEPPALPLSPMARRMWIAFVDHVEKSMLPDGDLHRIRGLGNKLGEHAARLAAVLMCVRNIDAVEIEAGEMEAGIHLAQHYAAEALRQDGVSRISADLRLAMKLLSWLMLSWSEPMISLPDIYQLGPGEIREKAVATKAVKVLEDHGWLDRIRGGAVVAGNHRRDVWRIIRGNP